MVTGVPFERDVRARAAPDYERRRRQMRRPQMRFNLVTKPYQIQPCMIMPVLPGETISNILLQSQVWSDPLAAGMKNVGWWCEYVFAYVRATDLVGWDTDGQIGHEMVDMMVSNASLAAFQDADGNAWSYCAPGAIDFVLECTKVVVGAFFRDEGESWNSYTLDNVPIAKIFGRGMSDWADKLTLDANYADRTVDVPATVGEMEDAWAEWASVKEAGYTDMDFDDWMRTYSANGPVVDAGSVASPRFHGPEIVAHFREFSYPVNTVEPTTGVPSTAAGWRIASRANKRIFCDKMGWLIGFSIIRPKVYLGTQQGAIAGFMQDRASWLPAVLNHHMDLGHVQFLDTAGPLAGVMTSAYWIDLRDLLVYGDQFNNYVTPATGNSGVPFMALPDVNGNRRYPSSTQIMALFGDTTNGRFRQDGVASLAIAGHQAQSRQQSLTLGATT